MVTHPRARQCVARTALLSCLVPRSATFSSLCTPRTRNLFSRHFGSWCLFPSSWAKHFFGEHQSPSELLLVFLLTHVCCPLLPAVDDAAFVYSLRLGSGSCSVRVSLNSCGADAAVVLLLSLSFLWWSLCNSSANATCISSLLRSHLLSPLRRYPAALFKWFPETI